jgi:hypothetical protein
MADHHSVGVDTGLHVFSQFERFVEFFGGLSLLLSLLRNLWQVDGAEAIFVSMDIILQRCDELCNDRRGHHDTGRDLLRLLHPKQEVDDKFVLSLEHDGAGGEDASSDMLGNKCTNVRMADFLTVRTIIGRPWHWLIRRSHSRNL